MLRNILRYKSLFLIYYNKLKKPCFFITTPLGKNKRKKTHFTDLNYKLQNL